MDEKEMQGLLDKIEKRQNEYGEAVKAMAPRETVEKLTADIQKMKDELKSGEAERVIKLDQRFEDLNKTLVKQGEELTRMNNHNDKSEENRSYVESLVAAYRDNADKISKGIKDGVKSFEYAAKSAATMTTANYTNGTVGLTQLESGVTRLARRSPFLREIVNVGGISTKLAGWVEQANADPGAAGMTAEGVAKTQGDFDLIERTQKVEKVSKFFKVTEEMLEDVDFIEGEIRSEGVELVNLKLDQQIYAGDGNTPNLKGILAFDTAFSVPSGMGDQITAANRWDVLMAAGTQSKIANFKPNYALVHPVDKALMQMEKTTTGDYVRPYVTVTPMGDMLVDGILVIENSLVTAGTYTVGDFSKSNLKIRKELTVRIVQEADDATKNLFTIICEMRAVHYVKTNHAAAFITGAFATDIPALDAVST